MMCNPEDELTATEAAMRLKISRERLIRLVQRGELQGRRDPERGWLVSQQDVTGHARAQHAQPAKLP
jgi:excisionase family DNA binding protein